MINAIDEKINICLVFNDSDGEYTKKCFPTIFSILENNKNEKIKFYLICKGMKTEYLDYLKEIFHKYSQELYVIDDFKEKEYLVDFFKKNNTSSWNYGIFFKLLIPFLLPEDVKKVINFDSDDVIVNASLRSMWEIELGENYIASVQWLKREKWKNKFNLKNPIFRVWWNVYNLEELRKINFEKEFKSIMQEYGDHLTTPESDILNILCNEKVLYINEKYNYIPKNFKIYNDQKVAYHFNDKKFFLFNYIFEINKAYIILYEKYSNISKYKIEKKNNLIRSLNSIKFFNFFIRILSKFLHLLKIKQFILKKFYW